LALAGTPMADKSLAMVELGRALADKLDAWDVIVRWAGEDVQGGPRTKRPAVPLHDNVTPTVYLKVLQGLGLVPDVQAVKDGDGEAVGALTGNVAFDPDTA
jgi:hypothetical protein